jgi:hypothetical protein
MIMSYPMKRRQRSKRRMYFILAMQRGDRTAIDYGETLAKSRKPLQSLINQKILSLCARIVPFFADCRLFSSGHAPQLTTPELHGAQPQNAAASFNQASM